jgi:hypothetical protein
MVISILPPGGVAGGELRPLDIQARRAKADSTVITITMERRY